MFIEPIFGKKFFGREDVLATLHKRVTALKGGYRQNLALAGPMLAGKSSILRHFLDELRNEDVIPLYIEMDDADFKIFCTRFMATLMYRYLILSGRAVDGDFDDLKQASRDLIPDTVKCIDKISKDLRQKKDNLAYETLLGLTSVFKTETGISCIVILDEFHNLSNFHLKKPFKTFGKFIMVQKNTMYIVSSSQKTLLKDILSKKLSLLFGNFEVVDVDGFDNHTARSFISEKIKDIEGGDKISDYLIQVTQGSPFYIEAISSRFAELMRKSDPRLDIKECLLEAFADLLYRSEGVLNQYFTNNVNFFLEKRSRKTFIPVLMSIARGNTTTKAIQSDLRKTDKDLGRKLQRLIEMDLVYNSGVFYMIADKLFEYWLKYVYGLKTRSMIDDMDIKYLEFKRLIEDDYLRYSDFSYRNVVDIIVDLFKSFKNEKIRINMNDRKMPGFSDVNVSAVTENVSRITGDFQGKRWVCHIKQRDITDEQDILDLSAYKAEEQDGKVVRKIFIPLKGVEQNAFLLAKEKNFWVWDPKKLNRILRLFGKFELVL